MYYILTYINNNQQAILFAESEKKGIISNLQLIIYDKRREDGRSNSDMLREWGTPIEEVQL